MVRHYKHPITLRDAVVADASNLTGYYNKAISASPVDALPGYVMGGLSWFAVPWLCATTMGLAGICLVPNMASVDVTAGLVLPDAAVALLGGSGAVATLLLVFFAVTSASSAEFIAVSSICTYDVYQTYWNPNASGKRLIYIAHTSTVIYAIVLASFATGLYYAGVGMGYLYLLMGVIISAGVLPASLTLLWSGQNWIAAAFSPILGLICSLIAWLVQAKAQYGSLTVTSTGANYPMLAGNVVALCSPLIFVPVLTYAFGPQHYDWESMKQIRKGDDSDVAAAAHVDLELVPGESRHSEQEEAAEQAHLKRAAVIARSMTVFLTFAFIIMWPWPMYGSKYIFSKNFFTGWVVIGIMWLFFSAMCVVVYPVFEGRHSMAHTFRGIWADLTGKRSAKLQGREAAVEDDSPGNTTPTEVEKMDRKE